MNPFKYGQIVSGEDFCPRPNLEKQVKHFIQAGQNILIQGERRVGKSSLVYETVNNLKKKKLLYIDFLEIKTTDTLCKRIVKSIVSLEHKSGFLEKFFKSIAYLRPVFSIDPITNQPMISLSQDIQLHPDSLEDILDLIPGINKGNSVVIVFDEFQDILNVKESAEILAVMRGKIQFHSKIPYIFMGSIRNRMYDIFNNAASPFFKSAIGLEISGLEEAVFTEYLQNKFLSGKRTISDDLIHTIFKIADYITGDVQQLCNAIWEISSYKEKIQEHNIGDALKLIFARESKGYESILVTLTGLQIKCLVGLAAMGGDAPLSSAFLKGVGGVLPATVKKSLSRLEQLKIIYRKDRVYKFVNPFFGTWLKTNNLFS